MAVPSIPPRSAVVLEDFEGHLRLERGLSAHTVRAYVGDVTGLLDHAGRMGVTGVDELDVRVLRSWLARLRTSGQARTTLARRAAAVRVFTAFAVRKGYAATDPGLLLGTAKGHRTLPPVLRPGEVAGMLEPSLEEGPLALRDDAMLELLYATGIRVGELCGLDLGDLDFGRRLVRVLGKGAKERSVPFGIPAERALSFWLERGRPEVAGANSGGRGVPRCTRRADRSTRGSTDGSRAVG